MADAVSKPKNHRHPDGGRPTWDIAYLFPSQGTGPKMNTLTWKIAMEGTFALSFLTALWRSYQCPRKPIN